MARGYRRHRLWIGGTPRATASAGYPLKVWRLKAEVMQRIGRWGEAVGIAESNLAMARAAAGPRQTAEALCDLGKILRFKGQYERARELLEEGLGIFQGLGNWRNSGAGKFVIQAMEVNGKPVKCVDLGAELKAG